MTSTAIASTADTSCLTEGPQEGSHKEPSTRKRNKSGRSSRRRKAKLKAIGEAEEQAWNGQPDNNFVKGTPTDRDRIWPGVLTRRSERLSKSDETALIGQLGYLPGNAIAVAARSSEIPELAIGGDVPIVLQLYPIAIRDAYAGGKSDGRRFKSRKRGSTKQQDTKVQLPVANENEQEILIEPFPTMYWLTHPLLRTLTSKLELGHTHSVKMLEDELAADKVALDSMERAHAAYGMARWHLLTDHDQKEIETRKWKEALKDTGVAGIRKSFAIKCLHAHLAHYLSGADNIVGKWVFDEVCNLVNARMATKGLEIGPSLST